jgi:hypothetical protein
MLQVGDWHNSLVSQSRAKNGRRNRGLSEHVLLLKDVSLSEG